MKARTLEEASQICRRNAKGKTGQIDPNAPKQWAQETMLTSVTLDNTLRVSKVKSEEGGIGYEAWSVAFGVCPAERIGGPFQTMREAKAAAEAWARGDPVQANLE